MEKHNVVAFCNGGSISLPSVLPFLLHILHHIFSSDEVFMSIFQLIGVGVAAAFLYSLCPRRIKWVFLLIISLAWYAYSGIKALPFLFVTAFSTWFAAKQISSISVKSKERIRSEGLTGQARKEYKNAVRNQQRHWLLAALLLNFGLLALLKYTPPLFALMDRPIDLLLPLGISFYTFQSTGYLLDVYNAKIQPEQNPLRYLLFVSFFPQLIQGPIARYDQLASQLNEPHEFDMAQFEKGLLLILFGFFKKRVIADRAAPFVSAVFADASSQGGLVIVLAVLLYSLQQYCDFSGGIDIVTGIAEMMGIRLTPNFRRPYFAVSLGDFWRRWHISLGSWMRDYVFYPFALCAPVARLSKALKTKHPGLARTLPAALGNILVFLLVGIWHGAQMNYVLWGLYNGLILAVSALLEPQYKSFQTGHASLAASPGFHVFRVLRTFLIVNIGWFFDRSEHALDAFILFKRTLTVSVPVNSDLLLSLGLSARDTHILLFSAVLLLIISLLEERGVPVRERVLGLHIVPRWCLLFLFILFVVATFTGLNPENSGFMYAVF